MDPSPEVPAAVQRALEKVSRAETIEVRWPIVTFRFPGKLGEANTHELLELMDVVFAQNQTIGLITDMRRMQLPEARVRRLLGEYQKTRQHQFARWVAGDAHIIENPLLRGLVTAINWIGTVNHPQGFFKSDREALSWTQEQIRARRRAGAGLR